MGDKEDEEVGESDGRLLFMFRFISKSLRIKVDKWHKMVASEEYKGMIMDFLMKLEVQRLIFSFSSAGLLIPATSFPLITRSKSCFFLKRDALPITQDNVGERLICGDVSSEPLDQLAIMVEEVFLPLLTSNNNQTEWPKTVAEDVKKRVLEMKDIVFRVKGEFYGRTLLALPQGIDRIHEEYKKITSGQTKCCDMELRCAIESTVLRWSSQLNELVKNSSATVFESEINPVPDAELNFWSQRAQNLVGIYLQLREQRVKKMATVLEKTGSAYFPCFQKLFKSIVSAMDEAKDVDKYLRTLVPYIEEIKAVPFSEAQTLFQPLVHTIALIWVHCSYFRSSCKLVIILKEIGNLLMLESNKLLDIRSLFDSEMEEILPKLKKVVANLSEFRRVVIDKVDKVPNMFPNGVTPVPWVFDEFAVFERFDKYCRRLQLLTELSETIMEYTKLEKVEVGGNKAHALTLRLDDLFENFNNLKMSFSNLGYDPTDIDDDQFSTGHIAFKNTILDCDQRLAAVACIAFDDCSNLEQVFKMMNVFGPLLNRPIIKKEIEPKYEKIITLFAAEVEVVQEICLSHVQRYDKTGGINLPPNWPPVAGTKLWANTLRQRLSFPLNNINSLNFGVIKTKEAEKTKVTTQQLFEFIDKFQFEIFGKWKEQVPSDIELHLNDTLLKVHSNNLIEVNFHKKLIAALKEVRYLKLLGVEDLPPSALHLFERNDELHLWNATLQQVSEWYNQMRLNAKPQELGIIAPEIAGIDKIVSELIANNKWSSSDNMSKIGQLHSTVEQLKTRLNLAQQNLMKVRQLINQWNQEPLYNRAKKKKDEVLVYSDLTEIHQRCDAIVEAGVTIFNLVEVNFHLLHNLPMKDGLYIGTGGSRKCTGFDDKEMDTEVDLTSRLSEIENMYPTEADVSEGASWCSQNVAELELDYVRDDLKNVRDKGQQCALDEDESQAVQNEVNSSKILHKSISVPTMRSDKRVIFADDVEVKNHLRKCLSDDAGTCLEFADWEAEVLLSFKKDQSSSGSESDSDRTQSIMAERPGDRASRIYSIWEREKMLARAKMKSEPVVPKHPQELRKSRKERKRKKMERRREMAKRRQELFYRKMILRKTRPRIGNQGLGVTDESQLNSHQTEDKMNKETHLSVIDRHNWSDEEISRWKKYLEMVDEIVLDGLLHAVGAAVGFLLQQMKIKCSNRALFEIKMKLIEPEIVFEPALSDATSEDSLLSILTSIVKDINGMALLIPRILNDHPTPKSFKDEILNNEDIELMEKELMQKCSACIQKADNFVKPFYKYSYLWMESRAEHLSQFLRYSRVLTAEELEIEGKFNDKNELLVPEQTPTIEDFRKIIDSYDDLYKEISEMSNETNISAWVKIDMKLFKSALLNLCCHWGMLYKQYLIDDIIANLTELDSFIEEATTALNTPLIKGDYDGLVNIMGYLLQVKQRVETTDHMFDPVREVISLLKSYGLDISDQVYSLLNELPERWLNLKKLSTQVRTMAQPLMQEESNTIRRRLAFFDVRQNLYKNKFKQKEFFNWDCSSPYWEIDEAYEEIIKLKEICEKLSEQAALFEVAVPEFKVMKQILKDIKLVKMLWDYVLVIQAWICEWENTEWRKIDSESMDGELKKYSKELKTMDKDMRSWELYLKLENIIKNLITALRAITELQNPAIRDRHWKQLMAATKVKFIINQSTTLKDLLDLNLYKYEDEVKTIVDKSVKEMNMEKTLGELRNIWSQMEFEYEVHSRSGYKVLKVNEEIIETLEENQVQLQNMLSSKFIAHFLEEVSDWQKKLSNTDQVIHTWIEVQRTWMYLESIFIGSDDIRKQLPDDSQTFDHIDRVFKEMLSEIANLPNVVQATSQPGQQEKLESLQNDLTKCEKALAHYLETKRFAYPRFYFVSSADLLDILSNGNQPSLVCRHLTKLYDSIAKLKFNQVDGNETRTAIGMSSKDGEFVKFALPCDCTGQVEKWLNTLTDVMRKTGRHCFKLAVTTYDDKPREQWVFDSPAQAALCGTQIWWAAEVTMAFVKFEEGYENAVKDYQKKQIIQLNQLICLLLGDLTDGDRQKVTTICTVDVHSRDVVAKLISMKVENSMAFQWQSQLRHRWDSGLQDCFVNICDAQFLYDYEYLGNTPRLVITPLTDRCYITLTQSLHLVMGGAPAGPAGTGKTETTKDLGKGLGIMVYVFNCSEQMDYKSCGNIYKGLSQTGAWGCFDEFNRISVDVLSVVAVQVKSVLDAVKKRKSKFSFQGEVISLVSTIGMFITMNPGYAGRAELPENLKALFRPCAMVVPDFELICEIMLIGEGFQEARILGKKFLTLYSLCKELLSKQDHYDWGLRAIKSVLVVAGKLKRGDRNRPEDQVLMRALRDFNIPKIITEDLPIFMGLIGDLFPALDVPRKRDLEFEKHVRMAAQDLKLQPEEGFVLKVESNNHSKSLTTVECPQIVQLQELFAVRHSVFIIGDAGTGKSRVWKTLHRTYINLKRKPHYNDLEPKAVTNNELFGIINPQTREWKDGLFSVLIREQSNMMGDGPKWMIMDGDIDPMWIESLNTVMDDNKVLTLASNERIALTPSMRLLFEISNLRTATPATVSRAGILYINPTDLGWNPYVTSWMDTRKSENERVNLTMLFDKYIPPLLEASKHRFKKITPIAEIAHIQMLCTLLEALLVFPNVHSECPKDWYEMYFVFSCIWAFGSACFHDQLTDWRAEFSKWWVCEFKAIKFPPEVPSSENVFSYFIDSETKKFVRWTEKMVKYELDYELPLQSTLVNTADTTRIRYFLDLLVEKNKAVMLVGPAGSGKSVLVGDKMTALPENFLVTNISFNFYTTSEMLQKVLEKPLEKKAGRNYAPQGNKTMIYFIDDMNMPEVDKYGTVQPHTLIRQHMDYQHWYDRQKLSLKDIHNIMFLSSMNPTAGSFTIDPRLQRHFMVFGLSFPETEALTYIYSTLVHQHISNSGNKFSTSTVKIVDTVIQLALQMHMRMQQTFLPTAIKFHYTFNLRDLSNIFQTIILSSTDCIPDAGSFIRVWMHEATRVYSDKLVDLKEQDVFNKMLMENIKKVFTDIHESEYLSDPLIYCHFVDGIGDPKYLQMPSWARLNKILTEAMALYNDLVASMNLVLFEDAMSHICRINRVMEMPRGNALLVGVGGSGKQSLSRLSAFISGLDPFQIQLKKGYSTTDLKVDLAGLYNKAGLKNVGIMFLMTDSQVPDERFLVLINDLLSSGEIPELFADDEIDVIINSVGPEAKASGLQESKENCWKFFIDRVRRNLKIILCFSPVGSTLRVRARKFPALVNCTTINWFMEWPQKALERVSYQFLSDIEVLPENLVEPISFLMAFMHMSVNKMSTTYLLNDRRHNYTTPKSFLELINLYQKLLNTKNHEIFTTIQRLQSGLQKLVNCAEQVSFLKVQLAEQEIIVAEKNSKASELIEIVKKETEKVSKEKTIAKEEERKCQIIEEDVTLKQKLCEEDLEKALPALDAAQAALNTLNKTNLTEMKSFGTPPDIVAKVASAVMVLLAKKGKLPKDRSWKAAKSMMGSADAFLNNLVSYNKENIHPEIVKAIQPYITDPEFTPENVITKSSAAAGLCAWVLNIMKFHEVWMVVLPKKKAEAAAQAELAQARSRLTELTDKINTLEEQLGLLTAKFEDAMAEKLACQAEEEKTSQAIDLANRLVNGLASENSRWKYTVAELSGRITTLPGDVVLVTAFISYVGCFTRSYREEFMEKLWIPQLSKYKPIIPSTPDLDPMSMLTDDATIATWNNEGLPNDRMSAENATILTNSERWPLMIDPQLQGIKWIKSKYGEQLRVIRLGQKHYLDKIERAVADGATLLIENIGEAIDPVLDNLLGRNLIRKGRVLKIGDREIDFQPNFRLILHTKLANPHYQPEIQAQTTLINFTVTKDGLEEQLLAEVVKEERPDLEVLKGNLTKQQNNFKIQLKHLEDELLERLSNAGPDILSDKELVEKLEFTKKTAESIQAKVSEAKITSVKIDTAREIYRPVATRASILYFIMNDLNKINPLYQFSLKAFSNVFHRAISTADVSDQVDVRVNTLIHNISFKTFMYTTRGLFECDKLIFTAQLAIQILERRGEISQSELEYLLRFPYLPNVTSQVDFLTGTLWGGIRALSLMDEFRNLDKDIVASPKRWKKFTESECPEREKFPQDWKNKTAFQRLCILRSLRPDRMTYAMRYFIEEKLGPQFTNARAIDFEQSYEETSATVPVFFILSPGVDPTRDVERVGKKLGFTADRKNLLNVSLGQGQERVAESAMEKGAKHGYWVILQNIHLVTNWLPGLDKKMESTQENPHPDFRLFLSGEPAADANAHAIPQGVLESSIKITNEPPTGMLANLHKALDNFTQQTLEMCSKESEFKAILFSLCYFHAVVAERRKFGPQGWNRIYPFNVGDLTISVHVLYNYLENNSKVPWEDLRYLFGEIMYGGHITDDWDRRLCRTYLQEYLCPELVEGELHYAAGFQVPPNSDISGYHRYVDTTMPPESPVLYGLHPNAEIGFLTTLSENLFKTILELQPRDTGASSGSGVTREEKVKSLVDEILDKVPDEFNIGDMMARTEDRSPYTIVAFQECERMNGLMRELKRSLRELGLGLKGELTITSEMEELESSLFMDFVPVSWSVKAYPSLLGLSAWFADLQLRLKELEGWVSDFLLPSSVWLAGFFNPQSFLTAIMQNTARKNEWPLDKMCLHCDVTKKTKEEFTSPPRDGVYINSLYIEGARWDIKTGAIAESRLKEMFPILPVIHVKALPAEKQDPRMTYECPVYKTRTRGPTYVWTFNLKSRDKPNKWVLAGVAVLLSV